MWCNRQDIGLSTFPEHPQLSQVEQGTQINSRPNQWIAYAETVEKVYFYKGILLCTNLYSDMCMRVRITSILEVRMI